MSAKEGCFDASYREIHMLLRRSNRIGLCLAICKCGHLQSDHSSHTIPLEGGKRFREYHHGGCVECGCKQFTFHRHATLEEAAELMLARS